MREKETEDKRSFDEIISDRIVGRFTELLPEFAATLGTAVGSWLQNKATIAIARDYRTDSRMMKRAFTAGLMAAGVSALDFHGAPTPLLQFYIRRFGADAGVMFTSSHYESDKTGIRIFDETGSELTTDQINELKNIFKQGKMRRVPPSEMSDISDATGAIDVYMAGIKNLINVKAIANKKFKVVIDSSLGPVSSVMPILLTDMNVDVIAINSFSPKIIPKNLPNSESIVSLAKTVKANQANLGIAFDVEGSRVVFCDENGAVRTSDRISSGLIANIVQNSHGTIVVSESLTKNVENIAKSYGSSVSKILRIQDRPGKIAKTIRENQGIFGASDTGSFWAPSFTVDSDGIYTSLKLLELLATKDIPLSKYLDTLPQLPNNHREMFVEANEGNNLFAYLEYDLDYHESLNFKYALDTLAGTKLVFKDGWVNVLTNSFDSKVIQLISEAEPFNKSKSYLDAVQDKINRFDQIYVE
jgi:phosphomannomutase / phosphoglucomutase